MIELLISGRYLLSAPGGYSLHTQWFEALTAEIAEKVRREYQKQMVRF